MFCKIKDDVFVKFLAIKALKNSNINYKIISYYDYVVLLDDYA